jgi:hypothetical protein
MLRIISELKRRNVFRVAGAYVVIAWLMIQIADTLGPILRLPEWITSAIALIMLLGFIPALLFSWVYEITPEGVKKESEIDRSRSITGDTAKKLNLVLLIAVVVAVTLFAYQQLGSHDDREGEAELEALNTDQEQSQGDGKSESNSASPSIAVLPFADLSEARDQEYFADGISEEILNALVKASGLKVAGRTSSFSFKNKDVTLFGSPLS